MWGVDEKKLGPGQDDCLRRQRMAQRQRRKNDENRRIKLKEGKLRREIIRLCSLYVGNILHNSKALSNLFNAVRLDIREKLHKWVNELFPVNYGACKWKKLFNFAGCRGRAVEWATGEQVHDAWVRRHSINYLSFQVSNTNIFFAHRSLFQLLLMPLWVSEKGSRIGGEE